MNCQKQWRGKNYTTYLNQSKIFTVGINDDNINGGIKTT